MRIGFSKLISSYKLCVNEYWINCNLTSFQTDLSGCSKQDPDDHQQRCVDVGEVKLGDVKLNDMIISVMLGLRDWVGGVWCTAADVVGSLATLLVILMWTLINTAHHMLKSLRRSTLSGPALGFTRFYLLYLVFSRQLNAYPKLG